MGRAMRGDDEQATPAEAEAGGEQYVNAVVTVPAEGLADFYQAVADWWQSYEAKRGRAMRGQDAPGGG